MTAVNQVASLADTLARTQQKKGPDPAFGARHYWHLADDATAAEVFRLWIKAYKDLAIPYQGQQNDPSIGAMFRRMTMWKTLIRSPVAAMTAILISIAVAMFDIRLAAKPVLVIHGR